LAATGSRGGLQADFSNSFIVRRLLWTPKKVCGLQRMDARYFSSSAFWNARGWRSKTAKE
ncbi:MAG: hypothetical protein ACK56G_14330, partial [Pirellulaceae bacterium]